MFGRTENFFFGELKNTELVVETDVPLVLLQLIARFVVPECATDEELYEADIHLDTFSVIFDAIRADLRLCAGQPYHSTAVNCRMDDSLWREYVDIESSIVDDDTEATPLIYALSFPQLFTPTAQLLRTVTPKNPISATANELDFEYLCRLNFDESALHTAVASDLAKTKDSCEWTLSLKEAIDDSAVWRILCLLCDSQSDSCGYIPLHFAFSLRHRSPSVELVSCLLPSESMRFDAEFWTKTSLDNANWSILFTAADLDESNPTKPSRMSVLRTLMDAEVWQLLLVDLSKYKMILPEYTALTFA